MPRHVIGGECVLAIQHCLHDRTLWQVVYLHAGGAVRGQLERAGVDEPAVHGERERGGASRAIIADGRPQLPTTGALARGEPEDSRVRALAVHRVEADGIRHVGRWYRYRPTVTNQQDRRVLESARDGAGEDRGIAQVRFTVCSAEFPEGARDGRMVRRRAC